MNRRKTTFLSVAAACILAVALMGSVYMTNFGGGSRPVVLPSAIDSGIDPAPGISPPFMPEALFEPVEVVAGNVGAVLLALDRPAEYSAAVTTAWMWEGGSETKTHMLYERNGVIRIQTFAGGVPHRNLIFAGESVYQWDEGDVYTNAGFPDAMKAEDLEGIPTWEDLLDMPEGSILSAEYGNVGDDRVLCIKTAEAVYGGEYRISLDTGLLTDAFYTDVSGNVVYRMSMAPPELSRPGDGWFTLPDGTFAG